MSLSPQVLAHARELGEVLAARGLILVTAESCTGGGIAMAVTEVAGSSAWFDRAFVTYSNQAKTEMLGVPAALIAEHGAVSEAVVKAMAQGAIQASRADLAVAVSGIAGPGGGSADKPVGTVWFAWMRRGGQARSACLRFAGERSAVRTQAITVALEGLIAEAR